jgi:hypothetical protein
MGTKIRVITALVIIVGVAFWSFNLVRERSYSGSRLAFKVGSGSVVVTNRGQEPVPVEMRADGRTAIFRVESAELDLKESSKRQGSGRNVYHAVSFELPPGQAKIDVTRGSNVQFISSSNQRIDAVVTPMEASGVRQTLIFTGLIILASLYYISRTLQHRWIGALRRKLLKRKERPESASV